MKVVLGNKQMMADEGIAISKAVDDYMRDMEVSVVWGALISIDCEAGLHAILCSGSLQHNGAALRPLSGGGHPFSALGQKLGCRTRIVF